MIALAVPTYNQAPLLRLFLSNWLRHGADLVPLIVVDDGSNDGTAAVLEATAHPRLAVHRLPHVSAAHARNHALRNSPAPWLAFSDTDCILDRKYFETLSAIPERYPHAPAVEGLVLPSPGPKPPFTHSLHNPGGSYATANMVFRAAAILGIGGFDEAFEVNFREDTDLALTILDQLGPIPFCADLIVEHPHLPRSFGRSLRNAWSTQNRLIRAEMLLFAKHPVSYARVRHHRDARGTLFSWCRKYFALYLKECLSYLLREPGLTAGDRLRAVIPSGQAMIVAVWEQACIATLCLVRVGRISRLRSP